MNQTLGIHKSSRGFVEFAFETHGRTLATSAKIACNKVAYLVQRTVRGDSTISRLHAKWHWTRYPFTLRRNVLWSSALQAWFSPEDESAIECMLHMPAYEPVQWVSPHPGEYVLDVGGYVGWYSIQAARLIGITGCVVVLEPDDANRRQLEQNLALNDIRNVQILPLAVWSHSVRVGWQHGEQPVWHKVREGVESTREAVSIDDLVAQLRLPRLDWIKLDIEGAEVQALKGATQTLASLRPKLFIEIHETRQAVCELLTTMNFQVENEVYDEAGFNHGWILARSVI